MNIASLCSLYIEVHFPKKANVLLQLVHISLNPSEATIMFRYKLNILLLNNLEIDDYVDRIYHFEHEKKNKKY